MKTTTNFKWNKSIKISTLAVAITMGLSLANTDVLAAGLIDHHKIAQPDFDLRKANALMPMQSQLDWVEQKGLDARWNMFGTPHSLINHSGVVDSGLQGDTPAQRAKNWLANNKNLFNMTESEVENLRVVNVNEIGAGHIVLLEQTFNGLESAYGGRVSMAIKGDKLVYLSSSLAGKQGAVAEPQLDGITAWLTAAGKVGKVIDAVSVKTLENDHTWSMLSVPGFAQPQRFRLVAMPTPNGVVPVYETIVINVDGGEAEAYTMFVNALDGEVISRQNRVQHIAQTESFTGEFTSATSCGPLHGPYTLGNGNKRIVVNGHAAVPANDVVIKLHDDSGLIATHDLGTTPDTMVYEPAGGIPAGDYYAQVCPYQSATVAPYNYVGTITWDDTEVPSVFNTATWNVFPTGPSLADSSQDIREQWCWSGEDGAGAPLPDCKLVLENSAARAPWDFDFQTNESTFTTVGNAAVTGEAWGSPLTPAEGNRPVSPTRQYDFPFKDTWRQSQCSPTAFADASSGSANDVYAATANLFAMHNRMHDWSYYLGFTEKNSNLQKSNFGATGKDRENDPEIGNVQAGALTGGAPSYLGRDNANQITLNDGIAPITNMYLWQPIAGAFYAPCSDGDYDMSVIGHEYGHAIQNRMVDGPNGSLSGNQGRAMGESWGDLTAVEYLFGNGFVYPGSNPFAVGAFVTGDKQRGIRNYAMNNSPLNYSNVGYDFVCNSSLLDLPGAECAEETQVHADGEIWSATNYLVRQALVEAYDGAYPYNDRALQQACADGALPVDQCPGNRRWIQLVHDAFLMLPATQSMLDARDAMLAADVLRFDGANHDAMWLVFANRGFGIDASTVDADDPDPIPSFASPKHQNASVSFKAVAKDEFIFCGGCNDERGLQPLKADVYVGNFEARAMPIVTTIGDHNNMAAPVELAPGTYDFLVVARGYGHFRFTQTIKAGEQTTLITRLASNWASKSQGTVAFGAGESFDGLIDDTETTNWINSATDEMRGSEVTMELGPVRAINRVQVSALPEMSGNRFTALRQFEVLSCNSVLADCNDDSNFRSVYVSPRDAFPAAVPRPTVANLHLREFDIEPTAATHLKLRVLHNQCSGSDLYTDGSLDNDPNNETDCRIGTQTGSPKDRDVRAAEFQAFGSEGEVTLPGESLVIKQNQAPVVNNDNIRSVPNMPVNIDVLANDFDAEGECMTVGGFSKPTSGNATVIKGDCARGISDTVTYTPAFGAIGKQTFTYLVSDTKGNVSQGVVTVNLK